MRFLGLLMFAGATIVSLIFAYSYRGDLYAMVGWIISCVFFFISTMKTAEKIIND